MTQSNSKQCTEIPLQIAERSGVNVPRTIVSNGIPLPLGVIFNASELQIVDTQGNPVEAGFFPLQKWQDGSWRFVLVNFLSDLSAGSGAQYKLVIGVARKLEQKIGLTEDENNFLIVTGPLKLEVQKSNFNVINRAWLDPSGLNEFKDESQLVESHKGGLTAVIDGVEYSSYLGEVYNIIVERQDEVQTVIKATGRLGSQKGFKLDYKVWIKAWAGSSEVEVTFNVANKEGDSFDQYYNVERISLDIPLKDQGECTYAFGGKSGLHEGNVSSRSCLYQDTSDSYKFIDNKSKSEEYQQCGKSDKCSNTGWLDLRNKIGGIGAAYRWFWQTNPSALEVNRDGNLSIQVWPIEHEPLKLYTGVAKTTDVRLYFHNSNEPVQQVADRLKAFQKLTAATAPTSWYCQDTGAVDTRLVDLDVRNYPENEREFITKYIDKFDEAYKKLLSHRDCNINYAPGEDGYGFMNFGDGWEYVSDMKPPISNEVTWWGNNYYDHPHCFFLQFFRTGGLDYLDYALAHTYHMMDIDTANYDPVKGKPGNYKQCPGVMHIKRYTTPCVKENGEKDFVIGGCDGHWHFQGVESLFEAYYTAGVNPALERGLEATELPLTYSTLNFSSETRSIGHTLDGLAAAYRHTWDEKYLTGMNQVWEKVREHAYADHSNVDSTFCYRPDYSPYVYVRNTPFQTGILLGGVYKYRCVTPFATGEDGTDNISCNTIACDIWGRSNEATGENSGWLTEEQRWRYSDVMTVSAGWLNSLYPEKNFISILRKTCENCNESNFPDRVKTFSQSFKYQWLTQFELAKQSVRNRLWANFTAFPRNIKAGETVTFNNQSLGMVSCLWDFGDGEKLDSAKVNVSHTYDKPGVYDVEIVIKGADGKESSIKIKDYIQVY